MATLHDIQMKIGTVFSGTGLKELKDGVASASKDAQIASRGVSQLSGAIAGMDGSAAKAAGAATTLLQAFMSGNVVLISTQAAMLAISTAMDYFKERADKAREAAEELAKAMHDKLTDAIAQDLEKTVGEANRLRESFESVTKSINAMTAATNALAGAESQGTLADLAYQKFEAMLAAESEQMAKLIGAEKDVEIARQKEIETSNEWTRKKNDAETAIAQAEERELQIKNQLAVALQEREKLENAQIASGVEEKELTLAINKVKAEQVKLERELVGATEAIKIARVNSQTVEVQAATATTQAATATLQAEISLKNLKAATDKSTETTTELNEVKADEIEEASDDKKLRKELKDKQEDLRDITQQAAQARRDLMDAERDLANAEADYKAHLRERMTSEAFRNGTFDDPNAKRQRAETAGIENMLNQMNNNFTVRDDQRAMREGQQQQIAWETSATVKQRQREAYRYENEIKNKSDAALTQEQRDFKEAYERRVEFEKEQETRRQEAEAQVLEATTRLAELQDAEKRAYSDIGSIKDKLENLGLK